MATTREHSLGGSNKLLDLHQAAEYLGVPVRTFEKRWQDWGLKSSFYGRRHHFRVRDLDHYVSAHEVSR